MVRMNIYPVPSGGGIPVGVHITPTVRNFQFSVPLVIHFYILADFL
jgi:hypothetical protein